MGAEDGVRSLLGATLRHTSGWATLSMTSSLVAAVATVAVPAALAAGVDAVLARHGAAMAVLRLALLLATMSLAEIGVGMSGAVGWARATAWLQRRLVRHVLDLGPAGTRRFSVGDLTSRVVGDCANAAHILLTLVEITVGFATAAAAVVALFVIDWRTGAAFVAALPAVVLILRRLAPENTELYLRYQRLQGTIAGRFTDALTGIRTIAAAGSAEREAARVLAPLPQLSATGRAMWHSQRRVVWRLALLAPLVQITVLAVGGVDLSAGRITVGHLLAVAAYVQLGLGFLHHVDAVIGVGLSRSAAVRLVEVLETSAPDPGGSRALPDGPGQVVFRDVTVRQADRTVLAHLDLTVPAGNAVAVVGRSATGKSLLAALVGRLAVPDEGSVLLDGVPVACIDPTRLRRGVAYAFERPELLGATVADAIAYGVQPVDRVRVEQAARSAHADDFIRRLPDGYDTPMALAPMSGGERQRVGLARALVREPRVLVLDDAMSSLDTYTEALVSQAIFDTAGARTVLVVAHRAATAARADLVAWLDGGRVRAMAPHAQLWHDPAYRAAFAVDGKPEGAA